MSNQNKETKLKDKSTRVKRRRLEKAGPLFIDQNQLEPGKHYRIVNDRPGEIQRRIRMGYKIVENKDINVGDTVLTKSRLDSAVVMDVGRTKELKGILMEIPSEDHEEILDELKEESENIEEQMLDKEIDSKDKAKFYGGIRKE
jgi:hypothetical protein